jgi:hypothetical protein
VVGVVLIYKVATINIKVPIMMNRVRSYKHDKVVTMKTKVTTTMKRG